MADQLRAAVVAGTAVQGGVWGVWADRERQALDGLRTVAAYLKMHANTDVARAITNALHG